MAEVISADAEDKLLDIRRGLHLAMDQIIREKDFKEGEVILRQVDAELCSFLGRAKVVRA